MESTGQLTKRQLYGTLAGLILSLLLAALDQTIVGTAMPRIIAQLNGFDRYAWVTTAFLLTSTVSMPLFAKLSDLYGRKGFFITGAVLFVLASALCGAAGEVEFFGFDGMNQLILFRALQGIGSGMMIGLIFTIIGDIFTPIERAKYQGLFAAVFGLASIFGPTLGGWITDQLSWRWTFYVNLPVGAIAVAAIYFEFHEQARPRKDHRIDWLGAATLVGCVIPLLLALTWAPQDGWTAPRVVWLLATAIVMLAAFLRAESRASEPFIPLSLFRDPVISIASTAAFLLGMGMFGVIMYLPLFMQGVLGVTATQSGSLLTPLMFAAVGGSIISGQVTARMEKYKVIGIAGAVVTTLGMFLMAMMDANTSRGTVVVNMIAVGLGLGVLQPIYTLVVQNSAPRAQMGVATASVVFFRSIGSTIGVAVFGSVMLSRYHHSLDPTIPKMLPAKAVQVFQNPLQLVQVRSQMEAAFARYPGGSGLLQTLMGNVKVALVDGLHFIFVASVYVMAVALVLHLVLKEVPLAGGKKMAASAGEVNA